MLDAPRPARARRRVRLPLLLLLFLLLLLLSSLAPPSMAQEPAPPPPPPPRPPQEPSLFRDPKDGAFDLSGWLATRTGVLPVVIPITEPAVGYGAGIALVSFRGGGLANALKTPPGPSGRPVPPDVAAVGGGLTENGTWAAFAGCGGHFHDDRWPHKGAVARVSPNLDHYAPNQEACRFNLDGGAVYQELGRRVGTTDLFAGPQFAWLDTTVRFVLPRLPAEIPAPESDTTESGLGAFLEYDTRDNSLTPSAGSTRRRPPRFSARISAATTRPGSNEGEGVSAGRLGFR